jgi:aryl-alcohol dehydrogenase-like predicted oxidoreductase
MCLNFALLNPFVDRAIVGVYSLEQLKNNVGYLRSMEDVKLKYQQLDTLRTDDESLLLPYKWHL